MVCQFLQCRRGPLTTCLWGIQLSQTLSILHFVSLIDLQLVHKTRIVFGDRVLILAKLKQLIQADTNDEDGVEEVMASVQGILCKTEIPPFTDKMGY